MPDGNARDSIAELHARLFELFEQQPGCQYDDNNIPTIAIQEVLPVFHTFLGEIGMPALTPEQIEEVHKFADSGPQFRLTPEVLFQTLLHVTGREADHFEAACSPPRSPAPQPPKDPSPGEWYGDEDDEDLALQHRGRGHSRDNNHPDSRSSSRDSNVTSYQRDNGDGNHPPSAFDGRNRRRTKPIDPPSSWNQKRPVPASKRRRSDAHSQAGSDTESNPPHSGRRSHAPSNSVSPKDSHAELPGTRSRPPSRQGSRPIPIHGRHQSLDSHHYGSPPGRATIDESPLFSSSHGSASMGMSHSSSPDDNKANVLWPRQRPAPYRDPDSDDDAEENEDDIHIVPDRLSVASLASLTDPDERLAALQKHLNETQRRNAESEKHLQDDLAAREQEIVDLQTKLDRRSEDLSIKTREEKELRVKERNHITAINNLEAEVNKLQRALESVRGSYETLKKQYADQIAESDKYRLQLRLRDNGLREAEAREFSHAHELEKAARDREVLENQINLLEQSLQRARVTEDELDTQRQDNIVLKETIDRLRFELDELRASHALELASVSGSSAPSSRPPTLGRSLGSEFQRGMLRQTTIREGAGQEDRNGADAEDDVGEEIYHTTIIKKRVPGGRGKKGDVVQHTSLLDYVDAMTQYDSEEFRSDASAQTDPPKKTLRVSTEVQTDPEEEKSRRQSDFGEDEGRFAASTSTTYHRLFHQNLHPWDEPPSYALSELEQSTTREDRAALDVLRKWHGVKALGPLPKGISQDSVEDWAALKRELGVECAVIDKIIEQSTKHDRLSRRDYARRYVEGGKRKFYNIYNTYVLGGDASGSAGRPGGPSGWSADSMGNVAYAVGFAAIGACSAVALMHLGNGTMTDRLVAPGSPIYADRALWTSANAMVGVVGEGFGGGAPPTSVTAVWHVLERLVFGATRVVTRT